MMKKLLMLLTASLNLSCLLIAGLTGAVQGSLVEVCENFAKPKNNEINPVLKAQVDSEIAGRGGNVNALVGNGYETRTPLMKFAEAENASLDAVKYLLTIPGIDITVKDTYYRPRTVLIYPAHYGNADIVETLAEYLINHPEIKLDQVDTALAKEYATGGYNYKYTDEGSFNRIIKAINKIETAKS
jgi:hypothetical protein